MVGRGKRGGGFGQDVICCSSSRPAQIIQRDIALLVSTFAGR
jgi:hypothetical protein